MWMADDTDTDADLPVAIKLLHAPLCPDPASVERIITQIRATAQQLNHPNIVTVNDCGEASLANGETTVFIAMELVNGEPLNSVLKRMGTLSLRHAVDMLVQTGRALGAAHRAGLVHGNVKPGHILVDPHGHVTVIDFGVAKAVLSRPTRWDAYYVAPEQALGLNEAVPSSDVYSLAVVAHETLTGQRPFATSVPLEVVLQHLGDAPPRLPDGTPPNVVELIDIALIKSPDQRYSNGDEFADAVEAVRRGRRPTRPVPAAENSAVSTWKRLQSMVNDEDEKQYLLSGAALTRRHNDIARVNERAATTSTLITMGIQIVGANLLLAEKRFADRAYHPFWTAIEGAASQLEKIRGHIRELDGVAAQYSRCVLGRPGELDWDVASMWPGDDDPPLAPFDLSPEAVQQMLTIDDLAARMDDIVDRAHLDFEFATIFGQRQMLIEQQRTNDILIRGFGSVTDALSRLRTSLAADLRTAASTIVGAVASSIDFAAVQQSHADEHRAHEDRKQRAEMIRMLDNIQFKRDPVF